MKLFSKNLTATDCLKRLSVPKRVLNSLPEFHGGHAVELQVRYKTMEWPLVCTIRKKGRYKKPVLSKGWRKFVLRNSLNVGDQLTLYKEEDDSSSLHYRVELKRATRTRPSSARSYKNVEEKRVPVLNYIDQTSAAITSCCPLHQFGSVRGTDRATNETNNTLFKQFNSGSDISDVVDVNNQENSKSKYSKEQERELKQFGAIVNSLKQFGLSTGGAELVDSKGQASLRRDGAKEETAVLGQYFNLGLTVGGAVVHVHDQATSSKPFYKTDQRVGFELDKILGSVVNLDLTLGHQY